MIDVRQSGTTRNRDVFVAGALALLAAALVASVAWPDLVTVEVLVVVGTVVVGVGFWALLRAPVGAVETDAHGTNGEPNGTLLALASLHGMAVMHRRPDGAATVLGADAERLIGLPPGEYALGASPRRKIDPADRENVEAALARFAATGAPATIEFRVRSGETARPLPVRESLLKLPDGSVLTTAVDATRDKELEVQADLAAMTVEEAVRGKTAFLANIDHEFRTPLNTIIGFTEIIKGEVLGPIGNERYAGYVGDIHASGQLLLTLVNGLLDLAKAEAGTLALEEEDTAVAPLLAECERLMRQAADRASVRLTVESAPDLPRLYVDPHKMRRTILVVLDNAIRYTMSGGSVEVAAARDADGGVEIAIADDGIGVDPAHIRDALDAAPRARGRKSGLGLPLARRLMELHGGRVAIEARPKRGTTVRLSIPHFRVLEPTVVGAPHHAKSASVPIQAAASTSAFAPRRILCIDRDPLVPRAVRANLRASGDRSDVTWRDTVAGALEAARAAKPNIVLADWLIPVSDGRTIIEALDANPATRDVPVVILTEVDLDRRAGQALSGRRAASILKSDLSAGNLKAAFAMADAARAKLGAAE